MFKSDDYSDLCGTDGCYFLSVLQSALLLVCLCSLNEYMYLCMEDGM